MSIAGQPDGVETARVQIRVRLILHLSNLSIHIGDNISMETIYMYNGPNSFSGSTVAQWLSA